jgi:hypothetical protein
MGAFFQALEGLEAPESLHIFLKSVIEGKLKDVDYMLTQTCSGYNHARIVP